MNGTLDATLSGELVRAVAYARGDHGVLGLIRQDHVRITTLLHAVERHIQDRAKAEELFQQAYEELRAHCAAEAQVVYAWQKERAPSQNPLKQAEREHDEILMLAETLRQTPRDDPSWRDRLESLHRLAALHFQDEEDQLFAAVRGALDGQARDAMAERYVHARSQVQEANGAAAASP